MLKTIPDEALATILAAVDRHPGGASRADLAQTVTSKLAPGWAADHISPDERDRFREMAETELLSLHEGNFARYKIKPSEFADWQSVWLPRP